MRTQNAVTGNTVFCYFLFLIKSRFAKTARGLLHSTFTKDFHQPSSLFAQVLNYSFPSGRFILKISISQIEVFFKMFYDIYEKETANCKLGFIG
jgi:hypothetical protein